MWKVIERILKEKNMTVYELSKRSGVNRQHLYAMRDGRIKSMTLDFAFRIADALEVDINEFRKE